MSDDHHLVTIELESGSSPSITFACTAPAGAGCRMVPPCYVAGSCEESHSPECDWRTATFVDAGECTVKSWIDVDPDIMGEGKIQLEVETEWTGDDWLYIAKSASVVDE